MSAKIAKDNIKNLFLNKYEASDNITVQDFEKILKRKPIQASKELARNIVMIIGYTTFSKQTLDNIVKCLVDLIPDYEIHNEKLMDKALSKKVANIQIKDRILDNVIYPEDIKERLKEIDLELTSEECDYLATIAYKKKQQGKAVIQYLHDLCNTEEVININEEKIIEIAHNFFLKLAKRIRAEEISLMELYGDKLEKIMMEDKEVEVLTPDAFLQGLNVLGLDLTDSIEYTCVIKILALNDDEKLLKFEYLIEIISDYGVVPGVVETVGDFKSIDDISLIIVFALSEHLVRNKLDLQDLLGNKVRTQGSLKVINSKDFFEIVEKIGVGLEDKEHVKLKELLSIDLANKNTLSLVKLKQLVEEFMKNEQLQDRAIKCYEEMTKNSLGNNVCE